MAKYRFAEFRPPDLTLEKLAEDVNLSVSQISRFESGKREPRVDEMLRIAARLGVPWQEIVQEGAASWGRVPLISWVSAGALATPDQVIDISEATLLPVAGLGAGEWFALTVEGDSMDRISPPGSVILGNRKDRRLVANACYVIDDGEGGATYKRFRPDPMRFEPVSTNPVHEPIFPEREPTIIGRVRRTILDM